MRIWLMDQDGYVAETYFMSIKVVLLSNLFMALIYLSATMQIKDLFEL